MQAGALFQVNEAINVFFITLRDFFISENWRKCRKSLSQVCSQNRTACLHYPANRCRQENVSQSKRSYDKFSLVKKIV
jgi:hypothetical protein